MGDEVEVINDDYNNDDVAVVVNEEPPMSARDKFLFDNSSPHKLTLPWSIHSGWAFNQGPIKINLKTRSAFIWGMVVMPEQLTEDLQLQMKISYYKLMTPTKNNFKGSSKD